MTRKLPVDPKKRRREYFKRLFQHLEHFHALMESGDMMVPGIVDLPEGEQVFLADMMTGIETLPPRQRQAFELICMKSYTESAARDIMLPDSQWTTPIQQYADAALERMIKAYDAKQDGTWNPQEMMKKRKPKQAATKELHHELGSDAGISAEPVSAGRMSASR